MVSGWLAHTALELGLPLQVHVGYGDSDLDLLACDPLRLTAFLRGDPGPRRAGAAAAQLALPPAARPTSRRSSTTSSWTSAWPPTTPGRCPTDLLRETLELVPFGKLLFSSDAYGLAELYLLGALLFRRSMTTVLGGLVAAGEATDDDAAYVAAWSRRDNARRAYAL